MAIGVVTSDRTTMGSDAEHLEQFHGFYHGGASTNLCRYYHYDSFIGYLSTSIIRLALNWILAG
jgi:hypothetical protein